MRVSIDEFEGVFIHPCGLVVIDEFKRAFLDEFEGELKDKFGPDGSLYRQVQGGFYRQGFNTSSIEALYSR